MSITRYVFLFLPEGWLSGEDLTLVGNSHNVVRSHVPSPAWMWQLSWLGRSGPNLEPGTMRVYVTNGQRNGSNIGRKAGPCPGSQRRWVLGSVHAFFKPFMPQTHIVPGFRLGPELLSWSRPHGSSERRGVER